MTAHVGQGGWHGFGTPNPCFSRGTRVRRTEPVPPQKYRPRSSKFIGGALERGRRPGKKERGELHGFSPALEDSANVAFTGSPGPALGLREWAGLGGGVARGSATRGELQDNAS